MADIGKAPKGFPRRMQAARALAGFTVEELAEKLKDKGERGLGARSLRSIEAGEHGPKIQDTRQQAILEACGLPEAFATAPLMLVEPLMQGLESLPPELREQDRDDILISRAFQFLAERPDQKLAESLRELEEDIQQDRARMQQQIDEILKRLPPDEPRQDDEPIPGDYPLDPKRPQEPPDDDADTGVAS